MLYSTISVSFASLCSPIEDNLLGNAQMSERRDQGVSRIILVSRCQILQNQKIPDLVKTNLRLFRGMYFANKHSEQILKALRSTGRQTSNIEPIMQAAIGLQSDNRHHIVPVEHTRRAWTSDEAAVVSQRRSEGASISEIATELNRSEVSVQAKAHRLFKRALSAQETKSFWQLIEENKPHEEIAREFGRSVSAVRMKMNMSKRGRATHKWTAEHKAMVAEYYRQGLNDEDIANALPLEVKRSQVGDVRRNMRLVTRPRPSIKAWTAEDDMQVRQFFVQGMNDSAIGSRLSPSRTLNSVKRRRLAILKLSGPSRPVVPWSDLEVEEMYRMVEQGLSSEEISKKLSGGSRTVGSINKKRRVTDLVRSHRENAHTLIDRAPSKPIRPNNAAQAQEGTIKSEQLL